MDNVGEFVKAVRESFPGSVEVYTQGGCFSFHLMLRCVAPGAWKLWYDQHEGHVYTEIDGKFWDIRGHHQREDHWYYGGDDKEKGNDSLLQGRIEALRY